MTGATFAPPVTSDITPAVLAIGRPDFARTLIATLRRVADVGHCMVFSFASERSARCLLDIGNIPIGAELGAAYSDHFHFADPNRDAIYRQRAIDKPVVLQGCRPPHVWRQVPQDLL